MKSEYTLAQAWAALQEPVTLTAEVRERMEASVAFLQSYLRKAEQPVYGVNTGFGSLQNVVISDNDLSALQENLLITHAAGAGDELQGIKRGIMEMADTIVINKADGDNVAKAKLAKTEFNRALHLFPAKSSGWIPKVTTCSAYEKIGIDGIWEIISEYFELVKSNHYFEEKRQNQNQFWMMETINEQLKNHFYNHPNIIQLLEENKKAVQNNEISPFAAAMYLLEQYFNK